MIHQLMYYSTARHEQNDAQLSDILEISRRNNERAGITGILLYGDGVFFQVLEGEEDRVQVCFERIRQDERHQHLLVAAQRDVPQRSFDAWSMGYMPLDRELHEGVEAFIRFKRAGNQSEYPGCDPFVRILIDNFMSSQRLT